MKNIKSILAVLITILVSTAGWSQPLVNNPCFFPYNAAAGLTIDAPCINVTSASGFSSIINTGNCGSGWGQPDAWGWFIGNGATVDVNYTTSTGNPILQVMTVVTTPCGVTSILCANANGTGGNESITVNTTAGTYYLIALEDNLGDLGQVTTGCLEVVNQVPPVLGCTDPSATNYNPLATVDDGSCTYPGVDYVHPTLGINNEFVGSCLVSDCGPFVYTDDGAFGSNYSNNIGAVGFGGIYRVFCPETAGNCMQVTFNSFDVAGTADYLTVGNGPTQNSTFFTTAPANGAGRIFGTPAVPFSYTSTDASGCLTFRFFSNGAVTAPGWGATLQCVPCAGGPNGTDNNDCITMTPLCSGATINGNASGPGIVAEGCTGSDCPAGGENHTNWYTFTAQTAGTIDILINPTTNSDDYDYAVYGPNVTCGALGAPLNCSDAAVTGNTGIQNVSPNQWTEDVSGDGMTESITANAGDSYILVVDEWSANAGSGYSLSFGGTASLDCSILPVELSSFTAEYAPDLDIVDLLWTTESERSNDYFQVEKSIDGINFTTINIMKGVGDSDYQSQYYTVDENPHKGVNFYRLKQVDVNGQFKYSDVVSVNILDDFYDMLSLFPNPTTGLTEVVFNSYTKEEVTLNVVGYDGKTIVNTNIDAERGGNRFNLDLSNERQGIYFVTITSRDKVYRAKLIKK